MAKAKSTKPRPSDPAKMSFEDAIEELEQIIDRIESGDIGLEKSLSERKRGDELIKRCRSVLDAAEQELKQIDAAELADSERAAEGADDD